MLHKSEISPIPNLHTEIHLLLVNDIILFQIFTAKYLVQSNNSESEKL